jgi:HlyD family secretion protein
MQLHVNVDEADVGKVTVGQHATFAVDAYPDRSYPARIAEVRYGSQTVQGVVTYEALLNTDNADLSLRPGMTATADITVRKIENVMLVPNAALRFMPPAAQTQTAASGGSLLSKLLPRPPRSGGKQGDDAATKKSQRVWTVREGQPVAIPVKAGPTDGAMTEIVSGDLQPGVDVIVDTITSAKN